MAGGPAASVRQATARRLAGQGAMLVTAFGAGQGLSLVRNALLGHWLSRGDFGTAATITLALQMVELVSDLGVERHIVQSAQGDDPRHQAAAHGLQVARGVVTALLLYFCAPSLAHFFHVPHAAWAFELAAIAPLARGFMHLDARRAQRHYDNRGYVALEVLPQALATLLILPLLLIVGGYAAVAVVIVVQAIAAVAVAHIVATEPYRIACDGSAWRQMLAFGWPIWLSAFPLLAVYQGERVLVGHVFGVEALAGFTVAFMATMVPGQIAAKVGHALILPALSEVRAHPARFGRRARVLGEATTLLASGYATVFVVAGEVLLPLAFGPAYHGLGALTACLALMWALRMIQAVPGMAVMAHGATRPLLVAGVIRALALPGAVVLALHGASLTAVVAVGIVGEIASLVAICRAANRVARGLGAALLRRSAFLVAAAGVAQLAASRIPVEAGLLLPLAAVLGIAAALAMAGLAVMPGLRRAVDLSRLRTLSQRVRAAR